MKKSVLALLVSIMVLMSATLAFAEAAPVSSVTLGSLITTTGSANPDKTTPGEESGLIIYLAPVEMTTHEKTVLESITAHVESKPVVEYFAPEVIESVVEMLPPETNMADLKMDEFFELKTEGYTSDHGDVQVAFEFVTPYTSEDTLVGMIGLLASSAEEVTNALRAAGLDVQGSVDENGVFWLAVRVEIIDGKVIVHLPQGVLELNAEYDTVFALFSVREAAGMNLPV